MGGMSWSIASFRLDFIFSREVSLLKSWATVKRTRSGESPGAPLTEPMAFSFQADWEYSPAPGGREDTYYCLCVLGCGVRKLGWEEVGGGDFVMPEGGKRRTLITAFGYWCVWGGTASVSTALFFPSVPKMEKVIKKRRRPYP